MNQKVIYLLLSSIILLSMGCDEKNKPSIHVVMPKQIPTQQNNDHKSLVSFVLEQIHERDVVVFVNPEYMQGKTLNAGEIQYVVLCSNGEGNIATAPGEPQELIRDHPYAPSFMEFFRWEKRDGLLWSEGIPLNVFRINGDYCLASMNHIPHIEGVPESYLVAKCFHIEPNSPQCCSLRMIDSDHLDLIGALGSAVSHKKKQLREARKPHSSSHDDPADDPGGVFQL